ncbi:MAG: hypothetical protein ABSG10_11170 [Terracidiphilus sp.]|jgi:hypothetical protein
MESEELTSPRPLTPKELELLNWLLEHGLPEAKTFAPQMEGIRATRWCTCGCPSISLHVEEGVPLGMGSNSVISDVIGRTPEGKKIGVLLFQKGGKLSILEVYSLDIIEGNWGFSVYESLQTWESLGLPNIKGSKE